MQTQPLLPIDKPDLVDLCTRCGYTANVVLKALKSPDRAMAAVAAHVERERRAQLRERATTTRKRRR